MLYQYLHVGLWQMGDVSRVHPPDHPVTAGTGSHKPELDKWKKVDGSNARLHSIVLAQ